MTGWLASQGVTHVAMEATGIYTMPVYHALLGPGCFDQVLVCNAAHVKNVPGRKTGAVDASWLAELLECGLLKGSFIPPAPIKAVRDVVRYRRKIVQERAAETQRLGGVLQDAGIKPAGAEHVGCREQARDQVVIWSAGRGDQGAVGQRDAQVSGLGSARADILAVHAGGLVPGLADWAGVVGGEERADHELAGFDGVDVAADLVDNTGVLVAHGGWPVDGLDPPVGPQVRAAHAGRGEPDDRVGRFGDLRIGVLFDADIPKRTWQPSLARAARAPNASTRGGELR
jgi:hypothetical protein